MIIKYQQKRINELLEKGIETRLKHFINVRATNI